MLERSILSPPYEAPRPVPSAPRSRNRFRREACCSSDPDRSWVWKSGLAASWRGVAAVAERTDPMSVGSIRQTRGFLIASATVQRTIAASAKCRRSCSPHSLSRALSFLLTLSTACVDLEPRSSSGSVDAFEGLTTLVPADPPVTVGGMRKEAGHQIAGVTGAILLTDETLAVVNCRSHEVSLFDQEGRFLRSIGRFGSGPGEFKYPTRIFPVSGDTFAVLETAMNRRVTVLSADGRVHETIQLGEHRDVIGRFEDGSLIAFRNDLSRAEVAQRAGGPGVMRASIFRLDSYGQPVDSITGLPAADAAVELLVADRFARKPLRLGRSAVAAVFSRSFIYGRQDDSGLLSFGPRLRQRGSITIMTRGKAVSDSLRQRWEVMKEAGDLAATGSAMGPIYSREFADTTPSFGDVLAGRDGWLWVQDPYALDKYPLTWTAYDSGRPVARVELPPRFVPFEFGHDYVVGVAFDDLNVERVEIWDLVPGPLPGHTLTARDGGVPFVYRYCSPTHSLSYLAPR
jgi:6-bladed beta-propeller